MPEADGGIIDAAICFTDTWEAAVALLEDSQGNYFQVIDLSSGLVKTGTIDYSKDNLPIVPNFETQEDFENITVSINVTQVIPFNKCACVHVPFNKE